jgi:hypothetical protein
MTPRPTLEPQPKLYFTPGLVRLAKRYAKNIFRAFWDGRGHHPKTEGIQEYFWQLIGRQVVACEIKASRPRRGPLGLSENIAIGILFALDEWDASNTPGDDDGGAPDGNKRREAIRALLKVVTIDGKLVD